MSYSESVSTFYDEWYRKHGKGMRSVRAYQQFCNLVYISPTARLLDVSCGHGELLSLQADSCEAHGIDISPTAIQLASRVAPAAKLVVGDGQRLPYPDESFDVVYNLGSLEHYPSILDGIKEIARVLTSNGMACVLVPNSEFVYYRFSVRKGTQQQAVGEELLSLAEWLNLLAEGGLHVVWVGKDHGPGIVWSPWGILRHMMIVSTFIMPLRWTYQFVFLCRRAEEAW